MEERVVFDRDGEAGAALLSVIMVVAAMSIVIVLSMDALAHAARLSQVTDARAKGFWAAKSAEAAGIAYVTAAIELTDARFTDELAALNEPVIQPLDVGLLVASLEDATNCFNLNALAVRDEAGWTIDEGAAGALNDLFQAIGFGSFKSAQLADAIGDWIDTDTLSRVNGAEDAYYRSLDAPYRTPGGLLQNVRELRAVAPFDEATYQAVRRIVCVRPDTKQAVLNVNTLSLHQAPLLKALLSTALTVEDAEALLTARPSGGWTDLDAVFDLPQLEEIAPDAIDPSAIDVTSTHFEVSGEITLSEQTHRFEFLYGLSNTGAVVLLRRRFGDE